VIGSIGLATGREGKQKDQSQKQGEQFFHVGISLFVVVLKV
jgi:hypothetical protein